MPAEGQSWMGNLGYLLQENTYIYISILWYILALEFLKIWCIHVGQQHAQKQKEVQISRNLNLFFFDYFQKMMYISL